MLSVLRFQLTIEAAGGPVVLEVTGPPGSREFLDAMIEPVHLDAQAGA
jgi:hypothetical protein